MPFTFQRTNTSNNKKPQEEPPDKRRRTGSGNSTSTNSAAVVTDADWGDADDDDLGLTEGQLEEIDFIASQACFTEPVSKVAALPKSSSKVQSVVPIGKVSNCQASKSSSSQGPKRQTNVPLFNTVESNNNVKTKSALINVSPKSATITEAELKRVVAENSQYKTQVMYEYLYFIVLQMINFENHSWYQ